MIRGQGVFRAGPPSFSKFDRAADLEKRETLC
jgi:hypothetical protein